MSMNLTRMGKGGHTEVPTSKESLSAGQDLGDPPPAHECQHNHVDLSLLPPDEAPKRRRRAREVEGSLPSPSRRGLRCAQLSPVVVSMARHAKKQVVVGFKKD
jgi:hypothetical protein